MYIRTFIIVAMAATIVLAATFFAFAESLPTAIDNSPKDDKGIFSFVLENDLFADTDRGYTNGVRVAWLSSETNPPAWAEWSAEHFLPLAPEGKKRVSIAVGQSMFTPADLSQHNPIPNDRPYAGWLYGSLGMVSDTGKTLDNIVLTVGVVGPLSYAEQSQKLIHHIIGSPDPKGWDNQLGNEPGVELTYERKWRSFYAFSPFGAGADVTPQAGITLGNVDTNATVGTTFRLGYDLPKDYGPPRIRPSLPGSDFFIPTDTLGGYLFAGVEGRAVVRNIFLDGNSFGDSLSISKEPFVGSLQLGGVLTMGEARLSYTHVFLTREFKQQKSPEQFGAITLSYRF